MRFFVYFELDMLFCKRLQFYIDFTHLNAISHFLQLTEPFNKW